MPIKKNLFRKLIVTLEGDNGALIKPRVSQKACPKCKRAVEESVLRKNFYICPHCGGYFRMSARERISMLADEGSTQELFSELLSEDILQFPGYPEKLESAQKTSGEKEAVITGTCAVSGIPCAIFAMEPGFMMGSMGTVVGEKVTRLFEYAAEQSLPVVGYTVSGGARMQEGILSLMQMAKVSGAVKRHSEKGLFYLVILTDPTTGGVTASFAMEGDIILSEPGALIGFAGPRVIEQTIRQKLPKGFQRAELLLEKGFLDNIVRREEQKKVVSMLLAFHQRKEAPNASV